MKLKMLLAALIFGFSGVFAGDQVSAQQSEKTSLAQATFEAISYSLYFRGTEEQEKHQLETLKKPGTGGYGAGNDQGRVMMQTQLVLEKAVKERKAHEKILMDKLSGVFSPGHDLYETKVALLNLLEAYYSLETVVENEAISEDIKIQSRKSMEGMSFQILDYQREIFEQMEFDPAWTRQ